MRERILAATAVVLGRRGRAKLNLSEVARQAGVSRPTFIGGFRPLDAALKFVVDYQRSYPGPRMVDVEPAPVIGRLSRVIPLMREQLERLLPGSHGAEAAATAVRVAVSHYLVRGDDDVEFLAQLRHAVGLRGLSSASTSSV